MIDQTERCEHGLPTGYCTLCGSRNRGSITFAPQGCICPPTSEQTCKNPTCPRGVQQPFRIT